MTRRVHLPALVALAVLMTTAALGFAQRRQAGEAGGGRNKNGIIRLEVDATDAPRRLIHVQMHVPMNAPGMPDGAAGGAATLLYAQWIPGEHGPTGPLTDVVSLRMSARGENLAWRRDAKNLYALQVRVPGGADVLDVAFDFISPPEAGGF